MSLTNCPECKKEISDKATACPHCGAPTNFSRPVLGGFFESPTRTIIFLFICLVLLVSRCGGEKKEVVGSTSGQRPQAHASQSSFEKDAAMDDRGHVEAIKDIMSGLYPAYSFKKKDADAFMRADNHYRMMKDKEMMKGSEELYSKFLAAQERYNEFAKKGTTSIDTKFGRIRVGDTHDSVVDRLPKSAAVGQQVFSGNNGEYGPIVRREYSVSGKSFALTFGRRSYDSPHVVLRIEEND